MKFTSDPVYHSHNFQSTGSQLRDSYLFQLLRLFINVYCSPRKKEPSYKVGKNIRQSRAPIASECSGNPRQGIPSIPFTTSKFPNVAPMEIIFTHLLMYLFVSKAIRKEHPSILIVVPSIFIIRWKKPIDAQGCCNQFTVLIKSPICFGIQMPSSGGYSFLFKLLKF
jgi:hypothetical protein